MFELQGVQSVAFGPTGAITVMTSDFASERTMAVRLDATGKTVWAHPIPGEVHVAPDGTTYVHGVDSFRRLDANGYLIAAGGFSELPQGALQPIYYYKQLMAVAPDGTLLGVGVTNQFTIQGASPNGGWLWHQSASTPSLRSITTSATGIAYTPVMSADGDVAALRYRSDGTALAAIEHVAPHENVRLAVATNGDVLSASATSTQAVLRRSSIGSTQVYQRAIALSSLSDTPAPVTVIALPGDEALWIRPRSNGGFIVERISASGAVLGTFTRATFEAFAFAGRDGTAAIGGTYSGSIFSRGWVEVIQP